MMKNLLIIVSLILAGTFCYGQDLMKTGILKIDKKDTLLEKFLMVHIRKAD